MGLEPPWHTDGVDGARTPWHTEGVGGVRTPTVVYIKGLQKQFQAPWKAVCSNKNTRKP